MKPQGHIMPRICSLHNGVGPGSLVQPPHSLPGSSPGSPVSSSNYCQGTPGNRAILRKLILKRNGIRFLILLFLRGSCNGVLIICCPNWHVDGKGALFIYHQQSGHKLMVQTKPRSTATLTRLPLQIQALHSHQHQV